jgi:hypothetical protein
MKRASAPWTVAALATSYAAGVSPEMRSPASRPGHRPRGGAACRMVMRSGQATPHPSQSPGQQAREPMTQTGFEHRPGRRGLRGTPASVGNPADHNALPRRLDRSKGKVDDVTLRWADRGLYFARVSARAHVRLSGPSVEQRSRQREPSRPRIDCSVSGRSRSQRRETLVARRLISRLGARKDVDWTLPRGGERPTQCAGLACHRGVCDAN